MKRLLAFLVAAVVLILIGGVGSTGLEQTKEADLPSSWAISQGLKNTGQTLHRAAVSLRM
ncbi:MAG: hypothetical protein GX115_05710 [Ruminiclostridium sp.]|nr:hypothetical protein [Ruminiclostridium sp.]